MRTASRSLLILLVVASVVLGACADDGELGGPAVGGSLAARIGDVEYTAGDLEAETDQWAVNPAFLRVVNVEDPGFAGRRSTALTSFVLSHRILSEQARQLADGYEPTDDEIDQILESLDQNFTDPNVGGSLFEVYPDDFRRTLGRDLAFQNRLQQSFGPDTVAPEVAVNPRFGQAEILQGGLVQVNPPEGPLPMPLSGPLPVVDEQPTR